MSDTSKRTRHREAAAGNLDYYFDALRQIEVRIKGGDGGRCKGAALIDVALCVLSFSKAHTSKHLGYAFVSARAIAEKVHGPFDGLDERQIRAKVRLVQRHIARIISDATYFLVESGGRCPGQRNANRYWPAVDRVPVHKKFDASAKARLDATNQYWTAEHEKRAFKRAERQRASPPKISHWYHDESSGILRGVASGPTGTWRLEVPKDGQRWALIVTAPGDTTYRLPYLKASPDGAQKEAKRFLTEILAGRVQPYDARFAWLDEIVVDA